MGDPQGAESPSYAMLEIFQECQMNSLSHPRLCANLKNLFDKSRFSHFCDEFFELCRYSLVNSERTPFRERTVDFITKFALSCGKSNDDGPVDTLNNRLLLKLFVFCMKYSECPNPAVRFRCMQITHKLLEGIGDNGVIPDELFRSLQAILLRRVQDVKASVRVQAVQALARMQDPTQSDCPAVEAFIWLARHDPTAEVRRAALAAMVLTTKTLPSLIERCRDLSDSVRRTAYKILAARSVLRPLSIAKRIRILHDGLSDRSTDVKQAAQELVIAWFKAADSDPINLLKRLDTEGVPETSQLLLDNLFTILPETDFQNMVKSWMSTHLTDQRILKDESYTSDVAFFWRALAEFLHKRQANSAATGHKHPEVDATKSPQHNKAPEEDTDEQEPGKVNLEEIIPSVCAYVDMTKKLVDHLVELVLAEKFDVKTMEIECVVENILRLAHSIDLSDEFGRRKLVSLIRDWVTSPSVPNTLCPQLLKLHAVLEPNLRKRINNVIEMISELCDPVETPEAPAAELQAPQEVPTSSAPQVSKDEERTIRLKIAKLDVRLNELNESMHKCVLRKEFEQATGLRDKCAELESERSALLHQLHGSPIGGDAKSPLQSQEDNQVNPDENVGKTKLDDDDAHDDECKDDGHHNLIRRCSPLVLLKANRLAALVVQQSPTLWRLPASLRSLLDSLIFPSIQHEDPSVRNQAILTLGLCCAMDLPLAVQYLPLFYSAMRVDHVIISETALKCIIDCLLIFGFRPFHEAKVRPTRPVIAGHATDLGTNDDADDDDDDDEDLSDADDFVVLLRRAEQEGGPAMARSTEMSKTAARLLKPIVALLDSEDDELRTTSALGLAKLLIYDRFVSSHVLSQLVLLWFNPNSEDRPAIRRGLACFFTDYACGNTASTVGSGTGNPEHQAALADAVLPTLTALIRAPASSPLSEVEASDVAALLVHLTDRVLLQSKSGNADLQQPAGLEVDDEDNKENKAVNEDREDVASRPEGGADLDQTNPNHDHLALILATEILKAPQSAEAKLYLRMLCQLHPSRKNLRVYKELLYLSDAMLKYADRSSILILHRFRKQVNQALERLGIDADELLNMIKREKHETSAVDPNESHTKNDSSTGDLDVTLVASGTKRPTYPTLIGSARVNTHCLIEHHPSAEASGMPSQHNNRTIMGLSVIDKSSRQTNLLTFSESDESDTTTVGQPEAIPSPILPVNGKDDAQAPESSRKTRTTRREVKQAPSPEPTPPINVRVSRSMTKPSPVRTSSSHGRSTSSQSATPNTRSKRADSVAKPANVRRAAPRRH